MDVSHPFGTFGDCKVANDFGGRRGRATNKVLNHHLRGWAHDDGGRGDGNGEGKEAPRPREGGLFGKHGSGNAIAIL